MALSTSRDPAHPSEQSQTQIYKSASRAITAYIRSAQQAEFFSSAPPLATTLLVLLLNWVNGKAFKKSGRLICWPSIASLAEQCGRCEGHTKRALSYLVESGFVKVLRRGAGTQTSTFQLLIPDQINFNGRGSVSGLKYSRAKKDGDENQELRAGALASGAPARSERARPRAPESIREKSIDRNQQQSSVPTEPPDAAAVALEKNSGGEENDSRMEAVQLLIDRGVPEVDAWDILSDPEVRIADQHLAGVIERIARPKNSWNPGGWWRKALRNHHGYGADPAKRKIERDQGEMRDRKAQSNQQTYYDEVGEKLIREMSDADVAKAHDVLIDHYESQNKSAAVDRLKLMDVENLKTEREFLRAAGRNKNLILKKFGGGQQ